MQIYIIIRYLSIQNDSGITTNKEDTMRLIYKKSLAVNTTRDLNKTSYVMIYIYSMHTAVPAAVTISILPEPPTVS